MTRVAYFTNHAVTRIKYQSTDSRLFSIFHKLSLVAFCKTIYPSSIAKLTNRLVCWHHLSKESTAATMTFGSAFSRNTFHQERKKIFFNFVSLKLWITLEFPFLSFDFSVFLFLCFLFFIIQTHWFNVL